MKDTFFPWLEAERREAQEEMRKVAEEAREDLSKARNDLSKAHEGAEQLVRRQVLAMHADGLALPQIARYLQITEDSVQETLRTAGLL